MTGRTPVLLGDDSGVFGIRVGGGPGIGVVICVTSSMTDSPAGLVLSDRLALQGNSVVVIDEPGHGESRADVQTREALDLACQAVKASGPDVVALVVHAGLLDAALGLAESRHDLIGVVSVLVPKADPMTKLAGSLATSDVVRMGMRPSTLRKLRDAEARARFLRLARAKLRRSKEMSGPTADPVVGPRLRSVLASGKRILLVAGIWDRATRAIVELASQNSADDFLETDCTYRGRLSGFATTSAQSWFADRVATWVRTVGRRPV